MLEKNALNAVVEFLKPEHFYSEQHQTIYEANNELFKASEPVDMRTVVAQLRKLGKLEMVDGAYKIAELTSKVSSGANIEYHARVIIEMAIKRDLIHIASKIHHDAYEDTTDVFELLDKTEQSIFEISDSSLRKNYDNMRNLMTRAIQELQALKDHKDGLTGVPTGFSSLDRMTSGWQKSDLVIIADTEFFERADMLDARISRAEKDDPAEVARAGFEAMMHGEAEVVTGWRNKLRAAIASVAPHRVLAEAHRRVAKPGSADRH
jgi:replicative DNA helicase